MAVLARLTIERWVVEVVCMFVLLCGYASSNDDQESKYRRGRIAFRFQFWCFNALSLLFEPTAVNGNHGSMNIISSIAGQK